MYYFLACFFNGGLAVAPFYNTWVVAVVVGTCNLVAYYFIKATFPKSILYQYVLSLVMGIFMAQYVYQMHGLADAHFFAFIASTILITYQIP